VGADGAGIERLRGVVKRETAEDACLFVVLGRISPGESVVSLGRADEGWCEYTSL
jgi:hypothetical protein